MLVKIFVTVKVPGLHFWPEANEKSLNHPYLRFPHRHMFHIKVMKIVQGLNRELEFFQLQEKLIEGLNSVYNGGNPITKSDFYNFKNDSCEIIATRLLKLLGMDEVEVSEDGENGSIVTKTCD